MPSLRHLSPPSPHPKHPLAVKRQLDSAPLSGDRANPSGTRIACPEQPSNNPRSPPRPSLSTIQKPDKISIASREPP